MIRYSKLPDNIISLLPEAINYLHSREDVFFAYLFGGLVKGKIEKLRELSPLWEMYKEGVDLNKVQWAAH